MHWHVSEAWTNPYPLWDYLGLNFLPRIKFQEAREVEKQSYGIVLLNEFAIISSI